MQRARRFEKLSHVEEEVWNEFFGRFRLQKLESQFAEALQENGDDVQVLQGCERCKKITSSSVDLSLFNRLTKPGQKSS